MTTLIDRIITKYFDVPDETILTRGEKLRAILEAELTSVNGVDELINDYTLWMEAEQNILENADHSARNFIHIQKTKGKIEVISQILKDLKQTTVASDEGVQGKCKICGKEGMYLETDNMMCDSCRGINTDERLKDSQPKEVKCRKPSDGCGNCGQFGFDRIDNYCCKCGAKIKWIA